MNATDSPTKCAWCGGDLRPRIDPRGRKARYCSGACRAAAARERARKAHQDELERAQSQTSIALLDPAEILDTVVRELDATTRLIRDRAEVPADCVEIVEAARRLVASAPQPLTRQQRRKLEREQKKTAKRGNI
ncbi:hypothetical protein [Corynebacterium sp. SA-MJD20WY100]|uniref:hypothetical protein n=1 Tax=Corynebacterium sp. SA-MJD20WY100 TaxID=3142969 RepID=UPI003221DCA3